MKPDRWTRALSGLGRDISPAQETTLGRYLSWLAAEAIPAGAIGPGELGRLLDRHLVDSMLFLHGWEGERDPATIWDLGSGAGLPGIPLAILLPETGLRLIDRSGRRTDLMSRAVRILDLPNVNVERVDLEDLTGASPMIVSRATLSPEKMGALARRHLEPDGVAVLGGSWVNRPREVPAEWEIKEIPPDSLDRTVWLLIMRG
ncbi:MAG: 16S rRNA (guanine(527)-N(7))-methyltransferase RsmG [Acidimicrobiia bacterium]